MGHWFGPRITITVERREVELRAYLISNGATMRDGANGRVRRVGGVAMRTLRHGALVMVCLSMGQAYSAVDFTTQVQPILEQNCVSCHSGKSPDSGLDLTTMKQAFASGDNGPTIVAKQPEASSLYTRTCVGADDADLMPPTDSGGPLTKQQIETLRQWISEGAAWPEGVTLTAKAKPAVVTGSPDNRELLEKIHALIVERSAADAQAKMADYQGQVPLTKVPFEMKAIPGGTFLMGSPATEPQHAASEGPQREVKIEPFWMGKCEVTWDEYEPFMISVVEREKNGKRKDYDPTKHTMVDAVSAPTAPYMEMSFGMGQLGYPAISMTQHAANKYCHWLSAQTGHFYRLPTEAEWEYACRAGTTTAYSFGDDPAMLDDYAWYYENSDGEYQKVGTKKPNPWGLYDMHGNVMEWTADQYQPDYFERLAKGVTNPYLKPTKLYPRSVRGGGWDDDPENLRSAFRRGSEVSWKLQDPQLPKSIWYHTDAMWLGFRIVRPQQIPTVEEMDAYWNSATGKIK